MDFKIINDQLYVYNNCSVNNALSPGAIVLTIDGVSSNELIKKFKNKISSDGYIETSKERAVEEWFKYFYSIDTLNSIKITYKNGHKIKETRLDFLSEKEIDSIRNARKENRWNVKPRSFHENPYCDFKIEQKPNIGILKIKWFDKIPFQEYQKFLDSSISKLNKEKINNLIVDLRWNIGGPREYPIYLLSKLIESPYAYCDSLITTKYTYNEKNAFDSSKVFEPIGDGLYKVVSNARGLGYQTPSKEVFKGNLFVLVNGQSNSSSAQFASLVHHYKRGTIVGEEPGGAYNGGTGEYHYYLNLKYSGIKVQIPRYRIVLAVDKKSFAGHGVLPHYEVKENIDDLLKGRDCVMSFVLQFIEKNVK